MPTGGRGIGVACLLVALLLLVWSRIVAARERKALREYYKREKY